MNPEKAESLSPQLQAALEALFNAIESLSEGIVENDQHIENLAQASYPQVALAEANQRCGHVHRLRFLSRKAISLRLPRGHGGRIDHLYIALRCLVHATALLYGFAPDWRVAAGKACYDRNWGFTR
jgi:hypothetical protein